VSDPLDETLAKVNKQWQDVLDKGQADWQEFVGVQEVAQTAAELAGTVTWVHDAGKKVMVHPNGLVIPLPPMPPSIETHH